MAWLKRGPKVGTPENPEILQPGEVPRERRPHRLSLAFGLLRWVFWLSLSAFLLDFACYGLLQMGREPGGALAWVVLVLLSIPAAVLTLVAVLIIFTLFFALLLTLFGRQIQISRFTVRRF